jgi:sigma-E factor negative regulatory protein RseA
MSEQLKESLSAVIDGEADEFEIRRVLNEAANDPELRGVWERFHLVRSVMRGEGRKLAVANLSARFWTQIDAADATSSDTSVEPIDVPERAARGVWATWGRGVAGVAVAAGVAAAVVLGFGSNETPDVTAPQVVSVQPSAAMEPAASIALFDNEPGAQPPDPAAPDLQRAHAYMLHHAHHVALTNRSVVPFVKVAAFQSR